MPPQRPRNCSHRRLTFETWAWDEKAYKQPSREAIIEALRPPSQPPKKKSKQKALAADGPGGSRAINLPTAETFPAPLVQQDDELDHDPKYPPQSLAESISVRNAVTSKRRTIYVVPPPEIREDVGFMEGWMSPHLPPVASKKRKAAVITAEEGGPESSTTESRSDGVQAPEVQHLVHYLQAFYHGLPAKVLESPQLKFSRWATNGSKAKVPQQTARHVALETGGQAIRVRCRVSPDKRFQGQLNLNDMLDAALEILPKDAYALLMFTHHDLYEDEEDDFCCGRAYGGSRVAVVSTARYHPGLDKTENVDREHSWPASHCNTSFGWYKKCGLMHSVRSKTLLELYPGSTIAAAVGAFNTVPSPTSATELSALWLSRVCKTTSHELGHCFGIDHCTYYACVMQGTAHLAEDSRQPPYLCPVDLAKVLSATGTGERERYEALLAFCAGREGDRMFAAFAAWIRMRLEQRSIF